MFLYFNLCEQIWNDVDVGALANDVCSHRGAVADRWELVDDCQMSQDSNIDDSLVYLMTESNEEDTQQLWVTLANGPCSRYLLRGMVLYCRTGKVINNLK